MNADLLLVLLLLGIAIVMFALNRPRADAVALIAMVALPFTGVVTVNEAIAGFANPNIVLIAAMFVVGEALARAGVARRIGDWLVTRGGDEPWRQLALLMLCAALLGAFMSSTGIVAMFIPVVMRIAIRTRMAPSQLMMPMACCSPALPTRSFFSFSACTNWARISPTRKCPINSGSPRSAEGAITSTASSISPTDCSSPIPFARFFSAWRM